MGGSVGRSVGRSVDRWGSRKGNKGVGVDGSGGLACRAAGGWHLEGRAGAGRGCRGCKSIGAMRFFVELLDGGSWKRVGVSVGQSFGRSVAWSAGRSLQCRMRVRGLTSDTLGECLRDVTPIEHEAVQLRLLLRLLQQRHPLSLHVSRPLPAHPSSPHRCIDPNSCAVFDRRYS